MEVRNVNLDWTWHDAIDARSPGQWKAEEWDKLGKRAGFWASAGVILNGIVESGLYWSVDQVLGIGFSVDILWQQRNGSYRF